MKRDSIISNTISRDILEKGHQSIRFAADGFSILISDAGYTPVYLEQFHTEGSDNSVYKDCQKVLEEEGLLDFEGETVLIADSMAATLVPRTFYDEEEAGNLLSSIATDEAQGVALNRFIRNRSTWLISRVSQELEALAEEIKGEVHILHTGECLISLADQVRASDHQRGMLMAEIQENSLDVLFIKEDRIQLYNRYRLRDTSDFIYHILNTLKQLKIDQGDVAVYLSGMIHPEHELFTLLGKYLSKVQTTPYYLEELNREMIQKYMVLSEGSKCV